MKVLSVIIILLFSSQSYSFFTFGKIDKLRDSLDNLNEENLLTDEEYSLINERISGLKNNKLAEDGLVFSEGVLGECEELINDKKSESYKGHAIANRLTSSDLKNCKLIESEASLRCLKLLSIDNSIIYKKHFLACSRVHSESANTCLQSEMSSSIFPLDGGEINNCIKVQ